MADRTEVVVDLKIGNVEASNFGKALSSQLKNSASMPAKTSEMLKQALGEPLKAMKASEAKGGASSLSGDIIGVIQAFLGQSFQDIVEILQSIVQILAVFGGFLYSLKVIADLFKAFWGGFKSLQQVWGAIMEVVSKMVSAFVNLLIPVLMPFLYVASIIAKFLNMTLVPLFSILMKALMPSGKEGQAIMQKILGGDLLGGLGDLVKGMMERLSKVLPEIMAKLTPLFDMLAKWILGFLSINLGEIQNTLDQLLGKELGGVVGQFITVLYTAISAIAGFIAQIVGGETFNKVFGKGAFEDILGKNKGFAQGVDLASKIQELWKQLNDFVAALQKDPIGTVWTLLVGAIKGGVNEGNRLVKDATGIDLAKMWEDFNTAWNSLKTAVDTAKKAAFGEDGTTGSFGQFNSAIVAVAKALNDWAKLIAGVNPANLLKGAIGNLMDWLQKQAAGPGNDNGGANAWDDFISRPGQGVASFSPGDTIIGVKDPSALMGGGGGDTYIFNLNGNGDRYLMDLFEDAMEKRDAKLSRHGYFQQGR